MMRENASDLAAFLVVAQEESFTKAAAKLGVSQSALSQTIRLLEARLGLRLLTRTTRRVRPTEAGLRLCATLAPRFAEIETELAALRDLRDKPAGTIRITATDYAADTILIPKLAPLLVQYPDLVVEVAIEYSLTDIVGEHFHAGVRIGEELEKDMIAVPISPPLRMAVVATPTYLQQHAVPRTPADLHEHRCINLRLAGSDKLYAWEFEQAGQVQFVSVKGQLILDKAQQMLNAALAGCGLAYIPENMCLSHLADGRLQRVLADWCLPFPGYYLYYPNRHHVSRAFQLVVETLRYRE